MINQHNNIISTIQNTPMSIIDVQSKQHGKFLNAFTAKEERKKKKEKNDSLLN
jgi:hypothetical protein